MGYGRWIDCITESNELLRRRHDVCGPRSWTCDGCFLKWRRRKGLGRASRLPFSGFCLAKFAFPIGYHRLPATICTLRSILCCPILCPFHSHLLLLFLFLPLIMATKANPGFLVVVCGVLTGKLRLSVALEGVPMSQPRPVICETH